MDSGFALIVIGILIIIVTLFFGLQKGLFEKFRELGDMTGMTYEEIVSAVGKPSSISWYSETKIVQWREGCFLGETDMITLVFTREGILIGIRSQHRF